MPPPNAVRVNISDSVCHCLSLCVLPQTQRAHCTPHNAVFSVCVDIVCGHFQRGSVCECIACSIAPTQLLLAQLTQKQSFTSDIPLSWKNVFQNMLLYTRACRVDCIVRRMRQLSVLCTGGIRSPTEIAEQRKRGRNLEKHAITTQ